MFNLRRGQGSDVGVGMESVMLTRGLGTGNRNRGAVRT